MHANARPWQPLAVAAPTPIRSTTSALCLMPAVSSSVTPGQDQPAPSPLSATPRHPPLSAPPRLRCA